MANNSLVLVIKTSNGKASSLLPSASSPQEAVNGLINHLAAMTVGAAGGSIDAFASTTAPVAATGTITLTNASIANNDTVTIGGVALTAKSSGATGAQFNIGANATLTAAALAAAATAHATLGALFTTTSALGVVTVTCKVKGLLGNCVGLATSNGTGFAVSAATLASGAGGAQGTVTTYRLGL